MTPEERAELVWKELESLEYEFARRRDKKPLYMYVLERAFAEQDEAIRIECGAPKPWWKRLRKYL